jgi:hypothetical protein
MPDHCPTLPLNGVAANAWFSRGFRPFAGL